ncbi:MAG: family 1 glycosylhydrolase [Candidatus Magasanikbacteria bacterium]
METDLKFPPQFFWGCATSAHQIEGGLTNDWSEWEKSTLRLKHLTDKQLNHFEFISGSAANSFENNNADIACMRELNLNAYRFSVDWSRIEPENGKFDQTALDYYLDFIKKLRAHHIEPFVTLWHWPLPIWLRDLGGWQSKKIIKYFDRFVQKVGAHLNSEVNFWMTLNEPTVYAGMSFLTGEWPPQKKNPLVYYQVLSNLIDAHCSTYKILKSIDSNNQVGIASHNTYFEAYKNRLANRLLKKVADWWWNDRFLNKINDCQDFVGLNYYFHNEINYGLSKNYQYEKSSDLNWGLHPEGMYFLLNDLKKYNKPIYITENGLADRGDQHRSWYIREILKNVYRAIGEGADVKGYFHWSLIDNFEWAHGFHPKFGLYEVDYQTFERKPRSSAEYYADICGNNRVV